MAKKLNATPKWADLKAIEAVYAEAAYLRETTGVRYEVDHIYPLQGKLCCGLHVHQNLQILPKAENIRKHNRMPEDYAAMSNLSSRRKAEVPEPLIKGSALLAGGGSCAGS